jgi:hypothetical protein
VEQKRAGPLSARPAEDDDDDVKRQQDPQR